MLRWLVPLDPTSWLQAPNDDGLFERGAVRLAVGDWPGDFDRLVLSKGSGYPLFIAVADRLHLPLGVAGQLTYLAAAAATALAFLLVTRRVVAATTVYLVLAFDPMNYGVDAARVLRDNWYAGMSLLLLSGTFVTGWLILHRVNPLLLLPAAALTGLSGAGFWLCREEGIWLLPALLVVAAGLPVVHWWARRRQDPSAPEVGSDGGWRRWLPAGVAVLTLAAAWYVPIQWVADRTEAAYGVRLTTDFASGTFPEAYAAWQRVRGVPLTDYVPINRAQREAVYAVSPAARELSGWLEGPDDGWAVHGCKSVGVCDDIAGGWMPWALRDAAGQTGHFDSEADFQAFFGRVRDEIEAACDDGRLTCAPALPAAMVPVLRASPFAVAASSFWWLSRLPFDATYYELMDPAHVHPIEPAERATLRQGIGGVADTDESARAQAASFQDRAWPYAALGWLYRCLFVVLALVAALGLVLAVRWRRDRRPNRPLTVLIVGLAVAIGSRLVLLAVVDTTQYAIGPTYHQVTRTMLLALIAVGAAHCATVLRDRAERAGPVARSRAESM